MNFGLRGVSAFALWVGMASVASSADVETPLGNWTGFHFGAGAGYGMVDHALDADITLNGFGGIGPVPPLDGAAINLGYDGIGGAGGLATIEAGYDYQFNNDFLVGLQADYTRSNISTDIDLDASGSYNLEATDSFSLLARGGRVIDDSTLLYVIGGWTRTRMNADISSAFGSSYNFKLTGLTFGSGVETALADNLTAKLEYRYTQYGDIGIASIPGLLDVSAKSDVQSVRAILSYHMGDVHKYQGDFAEADWSGFHAGLGGGMGLVLHNLKGSTAFDGGNFNGLGAKLDISATGIAGIDGALTAKLEAADSFSLLARAGLLSSPKVLWYGLAGWTRTTFKGSAEAEDSAGNVLFSDSKKLTSDGLTLGAGVEGKFNDRLSWKTEYRLTSFESQDLLNTGFKADSYMQTVRSVLSVRF
jgi:outer membrane immunogenic protein